MHVPLQNDVLVGIGLIEEHHGAGSGIEEGKEKEHLERAAADAGKIERTVTGRLTTDGGFP